MSPLNVLSGMLSRLSTEHVLQLLHCLRSSYKLACDFDLRPGLKFLIQKVAHTEVAVNLYKQAGASMVFYIHTLIKICSNIPSLSLTSVRTLLSRKTKEGRAESDESATINKSMSSAGQEDIPVLSSGDNAVNSSLKRLDKDESGNETETGAIDKVRSSGDNKRADDKKSHFSRQMQTKKPKINVFQYFQHGTKVIENPGLFVSQLQSVCDELCQTYIDILYDKEGTSCVDTMAEQQLFFLIAQPDDFPDTPNKPDLSGLSGQLEKTQARLQGLTMMQPVTVQSVQG